MTFKNKIVRGSEKKYEKSETSNKLNLRYCTCMIDIQPTMHICYLNTFEYNKKEIEYCMGQITYMSNNVHLLHLRLQTLKCISTSAIYSTLIYSTYLSFDMTSLSPQQTDIDIFSPDPLPPLQDQISFISIWELQGPPK